ncbi:phage N-6-adenine-methyltransferase [Serratia proteamaculans]|uniref:phage N-6-adenine-methyltransferase n=1 Tax=Serratia proteamaculans TaxID=28151 RepID=UPI0039B1084B
MIDFSNTPYVQALAAQKLAPTHELKEIGDQWRTPDSLFWGINGMFGPFVLDLFSDGENSKCAAFYTAEDNALVQDWSVRVKELNGAAFGNPPYSTAKQYEGEYITGMRHIMRQTMTMRDLGGRYVFLIKSATAEVWWPEDADHVAFIRGRIGFDVPLWYRPADAKQEASSAGFGAAIAVFDKTWRGPAQSYVSRDQLMAHGESFLAQIRSEAERLADRSVA